ncbi:hypothetical protein D8B26_006743 [Coccidioides posadasii str. Silveira]|uniref:Uncharacterized protein n=2 Tax=Coccidioides posadasii TaxID=199306 RepID=E9CRG4_COCPS|nr:hypothetical protein CPC735_034180 [Coccidioides posadasii C735 delta SOWgp]EER28082.1 hypothetical protein CPC735_034180 [Coccidioides posadasii C735 delta SOWgp]EFW23242.1 conserved hypothetical protein [Coccidioides posadasii str. Silveira]QVM12107.1 hypothetical protein D8B26_006743 [Coccidioides posadasii str. Silveira]|eukprot:XP_003070227.1 hypothetical protein CPC735_034180 [Coccidioides posadasii C735 delta SOWgp]
MQLSVAILSVLAYPLALAADIFSPDSYAAGDVIFRDFAIIGGGAAGTYAAIGLRDMNRSIALVERSGRLGGHAVTYTAPKTGGTVDFGVQLYLNNTLCRNFFSRLNTPIANASFDFAGTPVYADFAWGTVLPDFQIPHLGPDYVNELNKYPYLENGFNLPDPIPKDLLLPWSQYIQKYNINQSVHATLARPANPGNPLNTLAMYVFNDINHVMLAEHNGLAIVNANHDNSELYRNALAELGPDVLLDSTVLFAHRSRRRRGGVSLVVKTPAGNKLIMAKQLIIAMPQILDNMKYFGLDQREGRILSQIRGSPYYGGVINNTGLSTDYNYHNVGANTSYHVPALPNVPVITPTHVDGLFYYWYNPGEPATRDKVQKAMTTTIKTLQRATNGTTTAEPEFLDFSDFSPLRLDVSSQSITGGFYRDMYGLQGYRNTWYIGTLFVVGSSQVWNNTATMLPSIVSAAW